MYPASRVTRKRRDSAGTVLSSEVLNIRRRPGRKHAEALSLSLPTRSISCDRTSFECHVISKRVSDLANRRNRQEAFSARRQAVREDADEVTGVPRSGHVCVMLDRVVRTPMIHCCCT